MARDGAAPPAEADADAQRDGAGSGGSFGKHAAAAATDGGDCDDDAESETLPLRDYTPLQVRRVCVCGPHVCPYAYIVQVA